LKLLSLVGKASTIDWEDEDVLALAIKASGIIKAEGWHGTALWAKYLGTIIVKGWDRDFGAIEADGQEEKAFGQ